MSVIYVYIENFCKGISQKAVPQSQDLGIKGMQSRGKIPFLRYLNILILSENSAIQYFNRVFVYRQIGVEYSLQQSI